MKLTRNNDEYSGTPEEIASLINLLGGAFPSVEIEHDPYPVEDFAPLEDVVNQSKALRAKLAENPAFSPYGGVVASNEEIPTQEPINRNQSDLDTGIELI